MRKVAIAYIPVLHKGYIAFIKQLEREGVEELWLIGDEILMAHKELDYLNRKDRLRALPVSDMERAISALSDIRVRELTAEAITAIQKEECIIFMPKEDMGRVIKDAYFAENEVRELPIFLRWNKDNMREDIEPDAEAIEMSDFQKRIAALMREEAGKSFDWWRQVGAALIKDGEVITVTHNAHLPEAQQPNIDGDVRSLFKKGININYSTAAHAEVIALGRAAREGIATDGAELYVTDFPCPYCARLIASAGIKTLYFLSGYAVLEGDTYLRGEGVRIIKLKE